MRHLLFLFSLVGAYALLRGWPELGHPLMRTCAAVLLLVLGLGLWHRRRRRSCPRTTPGRAAGAVDYLAAGLGVLAVECLFVYLLSVTPPKAEELALALEARIHPEAASSGAPGAGEDGGDGTATGITGNWLWDEQGRRRLPQRSNATPTNKPEVFLRPGDPATARALRRTRPYLRAFALEQYEDSSWFPGPMPAEETPRALSAGEGPLTFPQPATRPGEFLRSRVFHPRHPKGQDVFLALQGATATSVERLRVLAPGIYRLPPAQGGAGYDYETSSRPLTLDQLFSLQDDPVLVPDPGAPRHLLALPADPRLRDSLLQIAVRTQGPLDVRLTALRTFLRRNCTYSLSVDNPDGLDPMENFLFHERRGHCEYFASAGALLCRTLGIPSRVAYGWTGGRYYESSNLYLFRAREAHAWTEILLEGVGWVVFDPTPADAQLAATSSVAPPDEDPPLDPNGEPVFDSTEDAAAPVLPWALPLLGVGLGLLPVTLLILRLRRRPGAARSPAGSGLLPDSPGYLTRFRQACGRHGHPMPPGRTLRQHLALLAEHGTAPAFAHELLDYHYGTLYGDHAPDRAREHRLGKAIRNWKVS